MISYLLIGDGGSDRALKHVIDWSLNQHSNEDFSGDFADAALINTHGRQVSCRLRACREFYDNRDLIFYHRDSEKMSAEVRLDEILRGAEQADFRTTTVPIITVKMTEAWLLIDESAIRRAAMNPNGRTTVALPRIRELEKLPDPKKVLETCLRNAAGKSRSSRKRFDFSHARIRVAEHIPDYSPLRGLSAFCDFERSLLAALAHRPR